MSGAGANIYDDVEIEDMTFDEDRQVFTYPCPCGDRFVITVDELMDGEEIARCPSCSLQIKVVYDPDELEAMFEDEEEAEQ